jgi:integrase
VNTSIKLSWNRRKKLLKNGTAQLFIQVYFYNSKKQRFIPTKVFLKPGEWEGKVINKPDASKINTILERQIKQIQDYDLRLWAKGERLTPERLDLFLKGYTEESFLDFWTNFVQSRNIANNTIENYNTVKKYIKDFGLEYFNELTLENILKFDVYLRSKGLKVSTIYLTHRTIKGVIRGAVLAEKLTKNPYDGFKMENPKKTGIKYLTEDELRRIETKQLPDRLDRVRDIFLFSCYTGLNFTDVCSLRKEEIIKDSGELWIRNPRQKTDVESVILLMPKAEQILNKYDFKLPTISNVRTNLYLKEIAGFCDITKNLTYHMARHTCGTLLLKYGVPIEVISKILGHSSIRTTQVYAKVLSLSVGEHLRRVKDKF